MVNNIFDSKDNMPELYSKEWFDIAFKNINQPQWIKYAAIHIIRAYGVCGIADPGYIANIIGSEFNTKDVD